MIKGGYQIIDLTGVSEWDGSQTVKGAFAKAKAGKPVLLSNFDNSSGFTYDSSPTDATKAICPIIIYDSGSFSIVGIVINADDTIETLY